MGNIKGNKRFSSINYPDHGTTSNEELINLQQMPSHSRYQDQNHIPLRPTPRSPLPRILNRFWILEFFCCIFALGCLLAIIALLRSFDGQPIPQWRFGITLNTIVSLLATFLAFSLTVPLSACLSQLKWLRFRRERPLMDFELIESAARGPQGSFMLLISGSGGFVSLHAFRA